MGVCHLSLLLFVYNDLVLLIKRDISVSGQVSGVITTQFFIKNVKSVDLFILTLHIQFSDTVRLVLVPS